MPQPTILLAEDNAWDAEVTQEALRASGLGIRVDVVRDGEAAMAYLRQQPPHASAPRPDLVLLDLNLPRKDGRETLAEMKADPLLRRIPVLVLTTSLAEKDVLGAYDLHANSYLHKPVDPDDYGRIVAAIERFWLQCVILPSR